MMQSIYAVTSNKNNTGKLLSRTEKFSVLYHNVFDYPLTFADLIKWDSSEEFPIKNFEKVVFCQNGYYFLKNRGSLVYKRVLRNRISAKKLEIAKKASRVLSLIPSIKMVAVTGSLAMGNSVDESDIDLMIITKKGALWTTRLLAYFLLFSLRFSLRRPVDKHQKDKLCLNLWMDESDLTWKKNDRNVFTAHEIAQILPLVNKDKTYEKLLYKNRWILNFWPNSVRILNFESGIWETKKTGFYVLNSVFSLLEQVCYKIQYNYMKSRITREIVTPSRAVFHPQDWGSYIVSRLNP